ncbi:putative HTH-type transcriptional regulator TtgW [Zhongshania aliphaticivorans]|uniref:Putative HTH-type transcriptional regulator TtgW n=1 Tax=Zhongshania aliphaticivorans TaxID=1470434 RepID=A0A5S9PWZ3_9GAMM|nr:TetR/AcrR family transcriptional regulator [Zhongshania aliphaticivorans]CAA0092260.1 putative HTH-type transcriptional regulator TtgW [Zhongshania aliphaticivorans]CAA0109447.1 putative HTH-type transcriptional regulator TtgW [Zhongshania aliphaticivorans]
MATKPAPKKKQERSSRDDWLRAALELLGEEGIARITIDALCKKLRLTKGSFYWHFSGRQELLEGMADRYANAHHREIRERIDSSDLDDWERIKLVAKDAFDNYARIDHAMRIWAEECEFTAEAIKLSDARTLRFTEEKLVNLGVPQDRATLIARLMLCTGLGFSFAQPSLGGKKEYEELEPLIESLIDIERAKKR